MVGVLETVNQRTQLVGENRLELLLFRLAGDQTYGINVFKVKEVLQCPHLTLIPKRGDAVRGIAHIRGGTIPILDLDLAIGHSKLENTQKCYCIITEYNMSIQGFLVQSVEGITNLVWEDIHAPPKGSGHEHYLTAVTKIDDRIVEIIDVEKILAEIIPEAEIVDDDIIDEEVINHATTRHVLVVDDSNIARKQIKRCVELVGCEAYLLPDGRQALDHLKQLTEQGIDVAKHYLMMISDIEMPEMDGYTLTAEVRNDPKLNALHVILHTSLSGIFNAAMVQKVGADDFLSKFNPDKLAMRVIDQMKKFDDGIH